MVCQFCLKETNNKKFCNKKCYSKYRRKHLTRNCANCNREFILKNISYEKRGGGKFCSLSCSTRKFKFNEKFFDIIDTEEKAYWLGFLYADGSQNGNQFQICLKIDDKSHLEKFKKSINSEHSVKEIIKKNHKKGIGALFQISSKYFCSSLEKQGCVKNKTFIVKLPQFNSILYRHFIRGVFDGDGTIGIMNKKYNYKKWTIYTASEKFAISITDILRSNNIDTKLYKRIYNDGRYPGYNIEVHKKNDINILYNYLYNDASFFLQRKKEKFNS